MKASCPSCGADVPFKSRFAFMAVCVYCKSTIVRHDQNLDTLGKMSDMPADMSPLQIGTTGIYEKEKFEILGRQKIGYENGTWNEWYILFQDGTDAWLADAQGFLMVSFENRGFKDFPSVTSLSPGTNVTLGKIKYTVDDIKQITCKGSQGELPFQCLVGRKSTSIDLVAKGGLFANIDYATNETHLFMGRYVEAEELELKNLRQVDGW